MRLFGIGDLHLSFGTPGKSMERFGEAWRDHPRRVAEFWDATVNPEDLVLLPGDISWAMNLNQAAADLEWIAERPGTKIMIRGNHDYWWSSISKVRAALPPTIYALQNDSLVFGEYVIAGTRLWDSSEYSFQSIIDYKPVQADELTPSTTQMTAEDQVLFERELGRLELSLKSIPQGSFKRIVMTHYPPIGLALATSRASQLLERYNVSLCIFGHLHSIKQEIRQREMQSTGSLFGSKDGVRYELVSCDWLGCHLRQLSI